VKKREHCNEIEIHKECESSFGVTGRESDIETEADECIFQQRQAFLPPAKTRVQGNGYKHAVHLSKPVSSSSDISKLVVSIKKRS
jgi:hypothetical protein